jgi:hypothetical protein
MAGGSNQQGLASKTDKTSTHQKYDYELFNCNNFDISYWSWNYRGCWHQTCPPIDHGKRLYILLIVIAQGKPRTLLLIVTSSLDEHWEICAPAAFLRCSSRLSGSFSGIEP